MTRTTKPTDQIIGIIILSLVGGDHNLMHQQIDQISEMLMIIYVYLEDNFCDNLHIILRQFRV